MNKIEKKDLYRYANNGFLTVGRLKKFIEENNLPDDAPVVVQRIEDRYYEGNDISGMLGCPDTEDGIYPPGSKSQGWGVYLKEGDTYHNVKTMNVRMKEELIRRKNGEPGKFPKIDDPEKYIEELNDQLKDQYHPIWSPVFYRDDKDILFLDLHY
jgi:hypothetical protein